MTPLNLQVMLHAGLSSIQDLSRQVAKLTARNKKLAARAARSEAKQQRAAAEARGPALCSMCLQHLVHPTAGAAAESMSPYGPAAAAATSGRSALANELRGPSGGTYLTRSWTGGSGATEATPPTPSGSGGAPGDLAWGVQPSAAAAPPLPSVQLIASNWSQPAGAAAAAGSNAGGPVARGLYSQSHAARGEELGPRWLVAGGAAGGEATAAAAAGADKGEEQYGVAALGSGGSAAQTEMYGSGPPFVRVNVLPSSASALPAATLSVWRQRELAVRPAATGIATSGLPDARRVGEGPEPASRAAATLARQPPVLVQLQSSMADMTISTGGGSGPGGGASLELSTASLGDWRVGGAGVSGVMPGRVAADGLAQAGGETRGSREPLALRVQLAGGGSPCRAVLTTGRLAPQGSGAAASRPSTATSAVGTGGGAAVTAAASASSGANPGSRGSGGGSGVPQSPLSLQRAVAVSLRFPRQDMGEEQRAHV
ncbi:hypothetical protein GPECTOR_22g894 [Gonium pectorale]|uniref:Uncharacterized protein n=1 Tax=Gonium pectorale TaxID=33097 RepID=A0A150GIS3_GONPE|nr:hypothetical protein GPECTOR_22g894 [Gonium pectorale]|eukprot:KXZ49300.1 hypothetical protein GPECTOR_22g894 [Gonium pectorale]